MNDHYQWRADTLLLHCHIQPKASRDAFIGLHNDRVKIAITAPPVDGKANAHLIKFVATAFGVKQAQVSLLRSSSGRSKTIKIEQPLALPPGAAIEPPPQPD